MLFFDLDGTLIDSNGFWQEIDKIFLSRRNLPCTREYCQGVAHVTMPAAAEFTKSFCNLSESCETIIAEWMELAGGFYAGARLKSGVREYLESCRQRGESMSVVTSCAPEHCHAALEHTGLTAYFRQTVFAQNLGMEKDNPDLWRTAARMHHVSAPECTVFDDSVSACLGARSAGMRVIGVYDAGLEREQSALRNACDRYVRSFWELL